MDTLRDSLLWLADAEFHGASMPAHAYDESGWPSLPAQKTDEAYRAMLADLEAMPISRPDRAVAQCLLP
ncbi:MAG: hypothetical protein ACOCZB_05765 [Spirochaetota bacterium]